MNGVVALVLALLHLGQNVAVVTDVTETAIVDQVGLAGHQALVADLDAVAAIQIDRDPDRVLGVVPAPGGFGLGLACETRNGCDGGGGECEGLDSVIVFLLDCPAASTPPGEKTMPQHCQL